MYAWERWWLWLNMIFSTSPDISDYTKAHLKTKSYVGVYRANTHGRCGQWVAIKHGDKTIRAKIIDSTAVSAPFSLRRC